MCATYGYVGYHFIVNYENIQKPLIQHINMHVYAHLCAGIVQTTHRLYSHYHGVISVLHNFCFQSRRIFFEHM